MPCSAKRPEELVEVVAELDGAERRDPDRAAELLGGVDDAGGLALLLGGDRAQPVGSLTVRTMPRPMPCRKRPGSARRRLRAPPDGERDAGRGEDEVADRQRNPPAEAVERATGERAGEDDRDRPGEQGEPGGGGRRRSPAGGRTGSRKPMPSSTIPASIWLMLAARKLRWRKSRNSIIGLATRQLDHDEREERGTPTASGTISAARPSPPAGSGRGRRRSPTMPQPEGDDRRGSRARPRLGAGRQRRGGDQRERDRDERQRHVDQEDEPPVDAVSTPPRTGPSAAKKAERAGEDSERRAASRPGRPS